MQAILEQMGDSLIQLGMKVIFAFVCLFIGLKLIKWVRRITRKCLEKVEADIGLMQFLDAFIKVSLTVLLVIGLATSFGVQVASLVTVLGSAGVTLGLALQGSLSNFAGGVLILLLQPFKVGDYIKEDTNGNEGTVKEISLFYTKLVTYDEKIIVLPNGTLANNSLTNVTGTDTRRMDIRVSVSYDSDIKKVKDVIMTLLNKEEGVLKDREINIFVDNLADSGIVIGVRCYAKQEDFWPVKWRVMENMKVAFDENNIEIPYPRMDVQIRT